MKGILYKLIIFFSISGAGFNLMAQSSKIDSLNNLLSSRSGEAFARTCLELSKAWKYIDPVKMVTYAEKALPIARGEGDRELECSANLLIGTGKLLSGDFEAGKPFIDRGIEQARSLGSPENICIGLNALGIYQMNGGNYDMAFKLFHEALEKANTANLQEQAANTKLNLGSMLTSQGERIDGLKYLLQALKYYEGRNLPRLISRIYNNIAVNYHSWKNYDQALHFYLKTLESYRKLNDYAGLTVVANNIGEIYKDKKDYIRAIPYYQRTIHLADSIGLGAYYKAYGWIGLAETYLHMDELDLAMKNVSLALPVFERIKMQEGIAQSELILAEIHLKNKNYSASLQSADHALELANKAGIIRVQKRACEIKSMIYADQKRYREAFEMLNIVFQKNDSLYQEEQLKELARLRGELDIAEKNNEIQLLQKDNEIKDLSIKKQKTQTRYLIVFLGLLISLFIVMLIYIRSRRQINKQMQEKNQRINEQRLELLKVNATKDKFMSIIGHDLRNPIGAFKDMIGQLADFPEMFPDGLRQQVIRELRDESERTYFLLENLLSWAKNQKNNISYRPEKLDLHLLVDNNILLNSRLAERKQIVLKSEVPAGIQLMADHNMVNLILRNLISNAIKFTRKNGEVVVSARERDDFIEISVADNGVGIPAENIPALFQEVNHISTYGTGNEKGSGIGLVLCREFVEMNGGTISVDSKVNEGSTFTFTLLKYKVPQTIEA